jgi:5-methylcytosine-specific restriction protein A
MFKQQNKHQKLYGKQRWRNRSKNQLSQHPLCRMCTEHGVVTPATIVDHVVPHHGIEQLFWFGELQSLCSDCHKSSKAQLEGKGYVRDIGVDGYPVDPLHPFNATKAGSCRR